MIRFFFDLIYIRLFFIGRDFCQLVANHGDMFQIASSDDRIVEWWRNWTAQHSEYYYTGCISAWLVPWPCYMVWTWLSKQDFCSSFLLWLSMCLFSRLTDSCLILSGGCWGFKPVHCMWYQQGSCKTSNYNVSSIIGKHERDASTQGVPLLSYDHLSHRVFVWGHSGYRFWWWWSFAPTLWSVKFRRLHDLTMESTI